MMTLAECAITVVSQNSLNLKDEIARLPSNLALDVYHRSLYDGSLHFLCEQLGNLDVFARLLFQTQGKRMLLHRCFQELMDHCFLITNELLKQYVHQVNRELLSGERSSKKKCVQIGIALSSFLNEAGWFVESSEILLPCLKLCASIQRDKSMDPLHFEVYVKLLEAYNCYYRFKESKDLVKELQATIKAENLDAYGNFNVAQAYVEFSHYYFLTSQYDAAFSWGYQALKVTSNCTPVLTVIDVLRNFSKTCVIKRQFKCAELLVKQALLIAKDFFDIDGWTVEDHQLHPKLGELFSDYAFYLQNADVPKLSVKCYQIALNLRTRLFCGSRSGKSSNLRVALSYEDLAYACYVNEYVSGDFSFAEECVDIATKMMNVLLPEDHLLLASVKRVKALVVEEIALDHHDKEVQQELLSLSEQLHLSALNLAKNAFGEMNVQTAKHYGNLGRLYQSMERFEEAEQMHRKAIFIKEKLLGNEDYEVALSLGHLASLYNYDLLLYEKAEKLYLRAIAIGIKLFGESFSGLEYDYRGLLRVYTNLSDFSKTNEYIQILDHWRTLREELNSSLEEESSYFPVETAKRLTLEELQNMYEISSLVA